MMKPFLKRWARGLVGLGLYLFASTAAPIDLVTPAEVRESSRGVLPAPQVAARSIESGVAPRIDLITPDISRSVRSPMAIAVRFNAVAPAKIDPESFRVLYGSFRLNITDRIRKVASVREDGIAVEGAVLPAGNHRLVLVIADSAGRVSEKDIRLTVE